MLRPDTTVFRPIPFGLEQAPDYTRLREHAHRERSKAISLALEIIWKRIRRTGSLSEQHAGFWQA